MSARFATVAAVVCLALCVSASVARAEEKKLAGKWVVVGLEAGGMKLPEEEVKKGKMTLEFKEKTVISSAEGQPTEEDEFTVDTSKDPHELTIKDKKGPQNGIYKFDGDKLLTCMPAEPGKDRPTKFETAAGQPIMILTLKKAE
jgi:uncharacterized protein (TIGR03067 family)